MELGSAMEGIDAVKAEVKAATGKEPKACIVALILGVRGKDVNVLDSPEGKLGVAPFLVVAVRTPMGMLPVAEGTVWFSLMEPLKPEGQGRKVAYCENCGQELPIGLKPNTDRRVMSLDFCDDRCRDEWRGAQNIASLDVYRARMNGVRKL